MTGNKEMSGFIKRFGGGALFDLALNESLRAVAMSFLSIFSSIYVYEQILRLKGDPKLAILGVFVCNLEFFIFKIIANIFAKSSSLKTGLKKQIYIGAAISIVYLFLMLLSENRLPLLFLSFPLWGLSAGFYWFGHHCLMVKCGHRKHFGRQIGIKGLIRTGFLAAAPLLGGLIIRFFGYHALFLASILFILLSTVVAYWLPDFKIHHETSLRETLKLFSSHKQVTLAYLGYSVNATIYSVFFPLFIFLILGKELRLGEFFSFSIILAAIFDLLIGRLVDKTGGRLSAVYGSFFQIFLWVGRLTTRAIGALFIFDLLDRFTIGMVGIPLDAVSYRKALDGHSTGRAIFFREIAFTAGEVIACLLLVTIVVVGLDWRAAFLIGAISSACPLGYYCGRKQDIKI